MDRDATEPNAAPENEFVCPQCSKAFNNKQNLIRHERRNHRLTKFQCFHCPYSTKFKFQLRKHITNIHINTDRRKTYCRRNKIPFKCCLCEKFECHARADMIKHYGEVHEVPMEEQVFEFANVNEFMVWKERTEFDECFKFTLASKHSDRKTNTSYYRCFRDGHYVPKGKGKRRLKLKGTNKTNSVCPCSVRLIRPSHKESCQAIYIAQHVGHSAEISRLTLTKQEKSTIAEKLSAQVPFNTILDSIRESLITSDYKRIHLTTFKDLHNIRKSFGLDEGPRRGKSGSWQDSESPPKARKSDKKQSDGCVQVNETEVVVQEQWHEAQPMDKGPIRTDVGEHWNNTQAISKDSYIAIKSPAHLLCNVDSWQDRPAVAKTADPKGALNPSELRVGESWHEGQAASKDPSDVDGTTNFSLPTHHTNDVVRLAWQGAQVIGKDCNIKSSLDFNSTTLQPNNVEATWQDAQGIAKHSNIRSTLDPSEPEIIVGWPELQQQRTTSHKDTGDLNSLQLNDTSQRTEVAVEDSWHDLEPSNDGSGLHQPNDDVESFASNDLPMQKQEVRNIFDSLMESVKNSEELELIKKAILPLSESIQSIRHTAAANHDKTALVPWWSKPY